jgi:hypothetical protein
MSASSLPGGFSRPTPRCDDRPPGRAALGVAVVAVLAPHAHSASEFHSAWLITVVAALAAGLTVGAIGPARRRQALPDALLPGAA